MWVCISNKRYIINVHSHCDNTSSIPVEWIYFCLLFIRVQIPYKFEKQHHLVAGEQSCVVAGSSVGKEWNSRLHELPLVHAVENRPGNATVHTPQSTKQLYQPKRKLQAETRTFLRAFPTLVSSVSSFSWSPCSLSSPLAFSPSKTAARDAFPTSLLRSRDFTWFMQWEPKSLWS